MRTEARYGGPRLSPRRYPIGSLFDDASTHNQGAIETDVDWLPSPGDDVLYLPCGDGRYGWPQPARVVDVVEARPGKWIATLTFDADTHWWGWTQRMGSLLIVRLESCGPMTKESK